MAKRTVHLTQTYLHSGKHYGPGAVELDEAIASDLEARERALRPAPPASFAAERAEAVTETPRTQTRKRSR